MHELIGQLRQLLNRREKIQAFMLMGAMLFGSLLEMLGVGAIPAFVAALTDPERVRAYPAVDWVMIRTGIETTNGLILAGASALLLLFIIKNIYLAALTWAQARYTFNRQVAVSKRLFGAYLHSPYTFHLQRNTAELLRNTNQDAMQVVTSGLMPLLQLVMEIFTVTAILILLLVIEPITSIVAFLVLGGTTAVVMRVIRKRTRQIGEDERQYRRRMIQAVQEGLGGIKVTKVLGRETHFLHLFGSASESFAMAARTKRLLQEIPRLILETIAVAGLLAVAALLLAQGRPTGSMIPILALLAVAIVRMFPAFNRITASLATLSYGRAAILGVMDDLRTLENSSTKLFPPLRFNKAITLNNISFTYPGASHRSLSKIMFEIGKGDAVAFVGATGAGKTTLVDVILGLLQPQKGDVLVDGESIRGRESAWQRQIGYIPQDVYLADTSIRQNIAFGVAEAEINDTLVWNAVDAAQVREFVEHLPRGLDTVVGERGVRLSGGQKQRIGIARALYYNPEVLIMDEATSALDHDTETFVMEAIENLRGSRTVLLIAHRLSTVKACEKVVIMHRGAIKDVIDKSAEATN